MMRKKLTRALLLVFCFAFVFAGAAAALSGPASKSKTVKDNIKIPEVKKIIEDQEAAEVDDQINFGEFLTNNFTGLQALIVTSVATGNVEEGCTDKQNCKLSGGLVGTSSQLMADMFANPAASGQTYLADLFDSAGIAQPAYAQGLGFASLNPILEAWKIFRNIAYFFFVIVFIVIGFMIMFRQKISGQAVVTAQQAIPSIIVALLLVTFSYAIAGFLIDIMYLFMFLMVALFEKPESNFIDGNFLQLGWTIVAGNTASVGENVGSFVNDSLGGGVLSNLAGIVSGLFVAVIFAIAIAIGMFRLFFNLLKRYVSIILSIATAPLILMIGAVPGKNTFGPWLKGLIGNLAAFPILLLALIISDTITGNLSGGSALTNEYGGFIPPYIGGAGSGNSLVFILGVGILLILSELVDKGAQALGAGKGPFDDLIGAAQKNLMAGAPIGLAAGGAVVGGVGGGLVGLGRGLISERGPMDPAARRRRILEHMGRGVGNSLGSGSKFGSQMAGYLGGSTPKILQPVEKFAVDKAAYYSDEKRLERIANPGTSSDARRRETYEDKLDMAQAKRQNAIAENQRRKAGDWGQLITTGDKK